MVCIVNVGFCFDLEVEESVRKIKKNDVIW